MAHFLSLFDANYLYAHDLKGRDVTVTIKEVKVAKLRSIEKGEDGKPKPDQRKPIIFFKESKDGRGLVLNKTNSRLIAGIYGVETDDWIGKRITLFPARVEAFKNTVDAIRVRPTAPGKSLKPGAFVEAPTAPAPEAPEHAEVSEPAPSDYPEGSEA
jgi:hypothetical protein